MSDTARPSPTPPEFGLVLACYNEAEHLRGSVAEIIAVLEATRWSWEIVFVDDVSKDDTRRLIDEAIAAYPGRRLRRLFHERNTGRGAAVSDGFRATAAPIVGYIDVDLEVHARYIPAGILAVERGADVVVAERIYRLRVHSLIRHVLSRGYHALRQRVLPLPVRDSEAGFKFFRRERLIPLLEQTRDPGWFWDTEIMVRAARAGCRIVEVPVLFQRRSDKTSTVKPLRDSLVYCERLWAFARTLRAESRARGSTSTRQE
jgi:glycosyltransferase involved in cell wall biosynthesis